MRFREYLAEKLFDHSSTEHQAYMRDIDNFTSAPRLTLKQSTIQYLKSKRLKSDSMILYRVLYTDDLDALAKDLKMNEIEVGEKGVHTANRVSSWSYSKSIVEDLANENDDLGEFAVILKAQIPGEAVVLNTDDLSREDRKHIYLFAQKEVIVDEGSYPVTILDVIDYTDL